MNEYIEREELAIEFMYADADVVEDYGDGDCEWGFSRKRIQEVINSVPSADVTPVRHGRWDDEHKCTVCRNEAFCKISNVRPDYDYDWEENLVETGDYVWDTEWLETTYCPHCGAKMDGDENA